MGIPAKKVIDRWKKKASFRNEYDALEEEFAFARILIAARARAGMSQADVAKKMKTTQSVIARLESGRTKPTLATLERFAKATHSRLRIELAAAS